VFYCRPLLVRIYQDSTATYLLQVAGILAMAQGDHDRAVALHEDSMSMYRDLGHKKGVSASLRELGFVAYERGDYDRAVRLHEQSLTLTRGFGTTFGVVWSLRALADAVRGQGDLGRARTCWKRAWLCLVARSTRGVSRVRSPASGTWRVKQAHTRGRRGCTKRA
jgi:tetratricopeptide (TPR) repeat protein